MTLNTKALMTALVDHAMTLGVFDRVHGHEPKNAPGLGINCAFMLVRVDPGAKFSGLTSTSAVVTFSARIFMSALAEPLDDIETDLLAATDALMNEYSADFTLGGLVRNIDLLGMAGDGLIGVAGYMEQDKKLYRVMNISLPLIINDVWTQGT